MQWGVTVMSLWSDNVVIGSFFFISEPLSSGNDESRL